jgi:hypothetical protein
MIPNLPHEILMGGWELICCALTAVTAVFSYLFMLR